MAKQENSLVKQVKQKTRDCEIRLAVRLALILIIQNVDNYKLLVVIKILTKHPLGIPI